MRDDFHTQDDLDLEKINVDNAYNITYDYYEQK